MESTNNLYAAARACIGTRDPAAKVAATRAVAASWREGGLRRAPAPPPDPIPHPGRPDRPRLVAPADVPKRGLGSAAGRAALVHALAHIELNAIDLAWDAVYRFRDLPDGFYDDWVRVAVEEAQHFSLLSARLAELGFAYGDFDAHDGLWQMARETDADLLLRMALVPRFLEARGLDVTPGMMTRLRGVGDRGTVAILEVILRDEIGHVGIGSRWFRYACAMRGVEPEATFRELLCRHLRGRIKGPIDEAARRAAGFSRDELQALKREAGIPSG